MIFGCASTGKPMVIDQAKVTDNCLVQNASVANPDFSVERFGVYFEGCFVKIDSKEVILSYGFSRLKGSFDISVSNKGNVRSNSNSPLGLDHSGSLTFVKLNSATMVQTTSSDFTGKSYYMYAIFYTLKNNLPHLEFKDVTFDKESPIRLILESLQKNDLAKVKELFDSGAINKDFHVTVHDDKSVSDSNLLVQAFEFKSNSDILKYLFSKKVDSNWNIEGWTPLMLICRKNDFDLFQFVFSLKKWDINAVTPNGDTYLHWATANKNIPMIQFLLKHGVNRNLKNKQGKLAKDLASSTTDQEIIRILE
jgi:hypothetical protein